MEFNNLAIKLIIFILTPVWKSPHSKPPAAFNQFYADYSWNLFTPETIENITIQICGSFFILNPMKSAVKCLV